MIKLSGMNFSGYNIQSTKAGSRFINLQFANQMTQAVVQFFNIDDSKRQAEMKESTGGHVTVIDGEIAVNTDWHDVTLYQHQGKSGVYFSFEEGFKYKEYDFVAYGLDRAGSNMIVNATLSMDDEKSFVVDWQSSTGEHRGARFINTRVSKGNLLLDAERFMDNLNTLAEPFGFDADEAASVILSGNTIDPITKQISATINKSYKGDKTYLTFNRVIEGD